MNISDSEFLLNTFDLRELVRERKDTQSNYLACFNKIFQVF